MSPGNIHHCEPSSSSTMWLSECDRIFIANYGSTKRSLLARRLAVRVVGIGFIGFVMADHAAGRSAQFSVTGHVAGSAADDSALDASFCIGAGGRHYRDSSYASRRKNPLHGVFSNSEEQFGQAKTVPAEPSDYDPIEVGGYPAVREDPRRLGQYLVADVAAGNVGMSCFTLLAAASAAAFAAVRWP
jgi:hypothetical protein